MTSFQLSLYSELDKETAFKLFLDELEISFLKLNYQVDFLKGNEIKKDNEMAGSIQMDDKPNRLSIDWQSLNQDSTAKVSIGIRFEQHDTGTVIRFETQNILHQLDKNDKNFLGWFTEEIFAPIFVKLSPQVMGDWLTDRSARRPSGEDARANYSDPLFHWPNFYYLLDTISLQPGDSVLEIGCGGGILLREFLKSGCKAIGIDHSPEMVKLARKNNESSIKSGRAEIIYALADDLPFKDELFTCVVMTGVFQFIKNPIKLLNDIYSVLKPSGRLYIYGGSKEMKGTPAAPEPFASRLKFYDVEELVSLARQANYSDVQVTQPDLTEFAQKANIPADNLWLFESKYSIFLRAIKPEY